jgi:hypothetical protein
VIGLWLFGTSGLADTESTRLLAVPTGIRRGDAVAAEKPSGLTDALSVRNYLCGELGPLRDT